MICPSEVHIQAYLDNELTGMEQKHLEQHLIECALCRSLLKQLEELAKWTDHALSTVTKHVNEQHVQINLDVAWTKFKGNVQANDLKFSNQPAISIHNEPSRNDNVAIRYSDSDSGRWLKMVKKYKKWAVATVAAGVVISSLTIPQVNAAANDFLALFRVQKFQMVKITPQDIQDIQKFISQNSNGEKTLNGLGTISVHNSNPEQMQQFSSVTDAEKAGYNPAQAPDGFHVTSVQVTPATTVTLQLNIDQVNKLLQQLGSDVQFDQKLNNKKISITVPNQLETTFEQTNMQINYTVSDTPSINVPADVDLDQLHDTILKLPFIPQNISSQLAGIKDWKHTLPFPYIEGKDIMENVQINGTDGIYAVSQNDEFAFLMWQESGKIHRLEAYMSNSSSPLPSKQMLLNIAQLYK